MFHANFTAPCFIETEKFYTAGIGILDHFCSCDLDLDLMTSYTNMTRIPSRYTGYANMNFLRQGFWKLLSDRHTSTQTRPKFIPRTTPLCRWSKNAGRIGWKVQVPKNNCRNYFVNFCVCVRAVSEARRADAIRAGSTRGAR